MKIVDGMYGVTSLESAAKSDQADLQRAKNNIPKSLHKMQKGQTLQKAQKGFQMPHHAALKGKTC